MDSSRRKGKGLEVGKELSIPEFVNTLLRRISAEPGCSQPSFDVRTRTITFRHPSGIARLNPQGAYAEHRKNPDHLERIMTASIRQVLQAQAPAAVTIPADFELTPMDAPGAAVAARPAAAKPAASRPAPAPAAMPAAIPSLDVELTTDFSMDPTVAAKPAAPKKPAAPAPAAVALTPEQQAAAEAERAAAVLKKKWADMAATLALSMQMDAEELRGDFRQLKQIELEYNTEGMRALDAWLCQTHKGRVALDERLITRLGAFTGQCMLRNSEGGQWIIDEGEPALQLGEGGARVQPAKLVQRLWVSGPDKDNPTLLQFYEKSLHGKSDAPGWGALPPPLPVTAPAVAGATAPVAAPAPRAATAPAPKAGGNGLWVDTYTSDQAAFDALGAIGARLAEMKKNPISLTRLLAPAPAFANPEDPLREIGRNQLPLLAEGELVWAALVRANKKMLRSGADDYPILIVYSRDRHFDSRPQELQQIAANLLGLVGAATPTPELREAARIVGDEQGRCLDSPVPGAITGKDVRITSCMGFRKHLPHQALVGTSFPLLVHAQNKAVMIAPATFWPEDMCAAWEPDERTYERVRKLPVGLSVSCVPNPINAVTGDDGKISWPMRTTLEALYPELSVFEFGLFVENEDKTWRLEGEPFDAKAFADRHRCAGGVIRKGQPVQGAITQTCAEPRARRVFWYYLARDPEGKTYRGDCVVEELAPPPPPPEADEPEPEPKMARALWGSLKNAIGAGELPEAGVLHDGVYKGKPGGDIHWLRLCEDGTALLHTGDRPRDLEDAMQSGNRQLARGSYKVMGDRIYIDIIDRDTRITLTGTANTTVLQLDVSTAKQKGRVKFSFVGWA